MPPPPVCAQRNFPDANAYPPPRDTFHGVNVTRASRPARMSFYMYRAVSEASYKLENVNLANLPGVLAYLHHEVVCNGGCPQRKFGIVRVLRFKMTVQATNDAYRSCALDPGACEFVRPPFRNGRGAGSVGHQFMRFIGFDRGKRAWAPKGLPSVGCASVELTHRFYNHSYAGATYYSLPGRCPQFEYDEKTPDNCCDEWEVRPWSPYNEERARSAQPFPYVPDPSFIWVHAGSCEGVYNTHATDASGDWTCGQRIRWLVTNRDLSEATARAHIAAAFPGACGLCMPGRGKRNLEEPPPEGTAQGTAADAARDATGAMIAPARHPRPPLPPPPSPPPPPAVRLCKRMDMGGECERSGDVGIRNGCTWHAEAAGEVSLDELAGIAPGGHSAFCHRGGRDWMSDAGDHSWQSICEVSKEAPGDGRGRGYLDSHETQPMCFWDGRGDPFRNAQRVLMLKQLFEEKYPNSPHDLGAPACGW